MDASRSLSKFILLIALCFSLGACSTFSFFFERMPWLSSWQMSRMFDLDDAQEAEVENVAEQIQQWLKQEGFPALILDLEEAKLRWQAEPSALQISQLFRTLEYHNTQFLEQLAPRLAPITVNLNNHNLEAFAEYLESKSKDWFESLESEEDKEDSRVERLENWFGHLSDAQVSMVQERVTLLDRERELRFSNTLYWSGKFADSVRAKQVSALEAWIRDPSIWWTEEYTQLRKANRQQIEQLLVALVPSLSDRQVAHAQEELQEWIDELKDVLSDE